MKFKFCGGGDCPLWALAALHALGSLPAHLFRALLQAVLDENNDDQIMEILKDTSLSSRAECARAAGVVRWALRAGWAHAARGPQLARDLAVLGVPRAHAAALADALDQRRQHHADGQLTNGFGVNKLTDVTVSEAPSGVDAYKLTLHTETAGDQHKAELLIEKTQARDLLDQLKVAYKKMQDMEESQE